MKKNIFYSALILLTILGCGKEQVPQGLILSEVVGSCDTTYLTGTIPTPQTRKILMEEATGVGCANCPSGATTLEAIKNAHPDRVISASVYSEFLNDSLTTSKYNFNSKDAMDLVMFIENADPSKPTSTINRRPITVGGSKYFFSKIDWTSVVNGLIPNTTTPLNIDIIATPGSVTNEYTIKTQITFTDTITADLALSIYLIEDGVIDTQDSLGVEVEDYEHNHILRKIITPVPGAPFLNTIATKEKGRVSQKCFPLVLPSSVVNKANCQIICFVHRTGSSKEVIHVEEIHLP